MLHVAYSGFFSKPFVHMEELDELGHTMEYLGSTDFYFPLYSPKVGFLQVTCLLVGMWSKNSKLQIVKQY